MNKAWLRKRVRDSAVTWHAVIKGRRLVTKRRGLHLLFDLDNVSDKYLLAFGKFEHRQQAILFDAISSGILNQKQKVFIDVGAHSGLYALLAWKTKLFDRIIAIEPDPRSFAQLKANLFLNHAVMQVHAIEAAASDVAGEVIFSLAGDRARDLSKVMDTGKVPGFTDIAVRSVRLDDLETMKGGFLAAKIDVEGYEKQVITGMHRLLKENKCCLQIEIWSAGVTEFTELMRELGFTVFASAGNDHFFKNY